MADTTKDKEEEKKPKKKTGGRASRKKSQEQIKELEIQIAEAKDKHLRLFAEFENFKKRNIKERVELRKNAAQETIQALLPVIDDFDRAKKSADSDDSQEQFSDGVLLVYNKLKTVMQSIGLQEMESTGQDFDPEYHAAMTEIPAPDPSLQGKIIDTIEKGYLLNDKIIRHARVVVGK